MSQVTTRKDEVAASLAAVEALIFKREEDYWCQTPHGNLMKGFDMYLDGRAEPRGDKKKVVTMGAESRWFSYSSFTFSTQNPVMAQSGTSSASEAGSDVGGGLTRSHKRGGSTSAGGQSTFRPRDGTRGGGRKKKRRRKGGDDDDDDDDDDGE
mmetsp:Transcript_9221/g.18132  ORF Transcript_9221/g.18132 Transcript_9221/m.18132 type:complete len:153 (-) Transcript_9221:278-736(-)